MSPDKLIREISDVFQVVKDRSSDDEIYIVCPVPGCEDKTGNRSINVKTLRTNCWRCHGKQPHHVRSLFHLMGLEFEETRILNPQELALLLREEPKKALTPVQEVSLPAGFELLSENRDSCYWQFCKDMAERKNLSIEDLEEAEAGFTREGSWEPFCIFPVIENPRIVYYQGRTYSDEGVDKTKKFPSKKQVPFGASYWIYNIDALSEKTVEMAIVVESILNVLSLRRRLQDIGLNKKVTPICTFTHYLSRSQVAKMLRYRHIKEWCILFDSDSTEIAEEAALSLSSVLPVSIAEMPHSRNKDGSVRYTNDANDDVDSALLAIDQRHKPNPNRIPKIFEYPPQDRPTQSLM